MLGDPGCGASDRDNANFTLTISCSEQWHNSGLVVQKSAASALSDRMILFWQPLRVDFSEVLCFTRIRLRRNKGLVVSARMPLDDEGMADDCDDWKLLSFWSIVSATVDLCAVSLFTVLHLW